MTAVYPTIKVYVATSNTGSATTDISSYVVSQISGRHGIFGYTDTERLSSIGTLRFDLDNSTGYFASVYSYIGNSVRVTVTLGGREKQVWYGKISQVTIDPAEWGNRRIHITALDWMHVAQNTRILRITPLSNSDADAAMQSLSSLAPKPPKYTHFDDGTEDFTVVFDASQPKAVVYSEIDKVVKSELGYVYLKFRENSEGETLRLENFNQRSSVTPLSELLSSITRYKVKWANATANGYVKWANASDSGYIQIDSEITSAEFDRTMIDSEWESGANVVNQVSITHIPRTVDTSNVVLYSLGTPMFIGASQKLEINGSFTNPNGGAQIAASSAVTPVATTDYLVNTLANGTGTNITSSVTVTFSYGANGFNIIFNNGGLAGYITFFQVRGLGVYKDNPIEVFLEETESQTELVGIEVPESVIREYSNELNASAGFAAHMIAVDRAPRNVMKSVTFLANTSDTLTLAFMHLEQGSKVKIVESQPSHTGYYYIQGIQFTINASSGIIYYTWYLKEADETICQPIGVWGTVEPYASWNVSRPNYTNAINFGILPHLENMPYFSYSLWVKRLDYTYGILIGKSVDDRAGGVTHRHGNEFLMNTNGELYFWSYKTPTDGLWHIVPSGGNMDVGVWHHVVVTYDNTTDTADPKFYVNGTLISSVVEDSTPSGPTDDDYDCPTTLFSNGRDPSIPGNEYYLENANFQLKDVRIYNRILSQADVTEMASNENDYTTVPEGLQFHGIWAPVDNVADYTNNGLLTGKNYVVEVVHGFGGRPYNEDETNDDHILWGIDPDS